MSSRTTRAKAQLNAAASTASPSQPTPLKLKEKPQSVRGRGRSQLKAVDGAAEDQEGKKQELAEEKETEKENMKQEDGVASVKATAKPAPTRKASSKGKAKVEDVFCFCRKSDNGTPMVYCVECKDWYHFSCVDLDEQTAHDISVYICPACSNRTGLHPVMEWEGPNAVEEVIETNQTITKTNRKRKSQPLANSVVHLDDSQESDDPGSEDDYTEEVVLAKPLGKRRLPQTYESESDSDDSAISETHRKRRLTKGRPKGSTSPGPPPKAKRKTSTTVSQQPPTKKAKITSSTDPTRKYCLGKLEELFQGIFLRYPHIHITGNNEEKDGGVGSESLIEKKPEELTDDERATVLASAKQFADELESCVYEIYCEPDKNGVPSAGGKYKDRFRTIQFNLSKPDRVVIHKRIATNQISPKEISLMSSTDLANEELKQSIKIAEQEALEHSILKKTTAPRAKITHKGLEDIEDLNGNIQDRDRRHEDEERMERERLARLRSAQPRQRTMSVSVPPESPVVPQGGASWGAPPPVPPHAFSPTEVVPSGDFNPQRPSLLVNAESDIVIQEPELNLADLINMEDDPRPEDASDPPQSSTAVAKPLGVGDEGGIKSPVSPLHPPAPPTPLSPFANVPQSANETTTTDPFFNLNTLWSVPARDAPISPVEQNSNTPSSQGDNTDVVMGSSDPLGGGANDGDFDMFLEEKEPLTPEASRQLFEGLPIVWDGKISMPLDSTIPQDTPVLARQMGGRPIEAGSLLWKTLFPSDLLRIDGRVPVENSAKFLLQMRMNPIKELVAVAFSPVTEGDSGFKALSDFLIAKRRHGLVFPWGQRPKEHHPGKEMYIIPLLSSDPLPDYMELLDDLKLPTERISNYMVGIWWLNRGKLAPPPSLSTVTPTPNIPLVITSQPSPPPPQLQPNPIPTLPSQIASLAATLPVDQKALAAEIATLTPEQMDLMMRALASSVPSAPLPAPPITAPIPSQPHSSPSIPGFSPSSSQSPWSPSVANYPPMPPYASTSGLGNNSPPQQIRQHNDRGGGGGGGVGRRGSGGGRGNRGRHRSDDFSRRPVDSGWPRKRQMQADSSQSHNGGWS
ncbi:hypothetical protein E1B28_007343 [Marasmius oreades]|uniref:Transcription factor BYE1 n=1 Tax=Marasmius oreades TaxID=181124 RepID=A0A9P7S259_9AGAR|nr:uncharacterized protein E1B28_007343 [Marasmius oreades]KAG7093685.1 hypothetical protein E1B28_007343 [Marasmius oreades]